MCTHPNNNHASFFHHQYYSNLHFEVIDKLIIVGKYHVLGLAALDSLKISRGYICNHYVCWLEDFLALS